MARPSRFLQRDERRHGRVGRQRARQVEDRTQGGVAPVLVAGHRGVLAGDAAQRAVQGEGQQFGAATLAEPIVRATAPSRAMLSAGPPQVSPASGEVVQLGCAVDPSGENLLAPACLSRP